LYSENNQVKGDTKVKKTKKPIALFLALAMTTTLLYGCAGNEAKTGGSESTTESESGTGSAAAPADGPLVPFEKTVTVNIVGQNNPTVIYVNGESMEDNVITRFYKEKLNVETPKKWTVDTTKYKEHIDLSIASNDLADTFDVSSAQLNRLINNGQVADLTEAYEKYASENLRNTMEYMDKIGLQTSTVDGKIYGLPLPNDFADFIAMTYIRQDWLDKLGLKAPTTLAELEAVATAFVKQDPDGNGKADTLGIAMDQTFGFPMDGIGATLGAYPKIWLNDESNPGSLKYGSIQPEMKETLAKMQQFYKDGLFDKEFAVKNAEKVAETVAAGKVGIFIGPFWAPLWQLQLNKKNDPNAVWNVYPIPANQDGELLPKAASFVYRWQVVSKDFENPEAIIKMANLWYELWQGEHAAWYHGLNKAEYKDVQEGLKFYAPFWFDVPDKNMKLGYVMREALEKDDPSIIKSPEGQKMWDVIKEGSLYGWSQQLITTQSEFVLGEQYKGNYMFDKFNGAPSANMLAKKPILEKLESEMFTKIIMGESLDTFDTFVTEWKRLGGEEITKEVSTWYEANGK
jgi:putative aldouronate transport system substrate-binding protein